MIILLSETHIFLLMSVIVSFILIALYNVQDYIENPFDQKGLDDLKLKKMDVSKSVSLY
jgi:predicted membrane chloride channel (bestrophin family)